MWVRLSSIGAISYFSEPCVTYYRDAENRSIHQPNWAENCSKLLFKMCINKNSLKLIKEDSRSLNKYIKNLAYKTIIDFYKSNQIKKAFKLQIKMRGIISIKNHFKLMIKFYIFLFKLN